MIDVTERRFGALLRHTDGDFVIVSAYATSLAEAEAEVIRRYLVRPHFRDVTIEALAWCDYMDQMPSWERTP